MTRRYVEDQLPALCAVDLRIWPGEALAIVGRSGSGKSTLLSILGLLDEPDEGHVRIDGARVDTDSDRRRSDRRAVELGFVFQRSHLIADLTARENVALGLRYAGIPEAEIDASAKRALVDVGLVHRVDARARTLSGGEMQRVAIARTMARPARLWLADEPTGNLDSAQSAEIIELLKERAHARGAALVVVTHEGDVAARMDRVVTLEDGHIVADTRNEPGAPNQHDDQHTRVGDDPPRRDRRGVVVRTWRFTGQSWRAQPKRAWTGIAATAVAVALSVSALGLGQSAGTQVTSLFDAQRATQVSAGLVFPSGHAPRFPIRQAMVEAYPGVVSAAYWRIWFLVPMSNGDIAQTTAQFVVAEGDPFTATGSSVRWAPNVDEILDPGEAVIGEALAERLGLAQIDLQPELAVNGRTLRVVGVLTSSRVGAASGSVFVSPETPTGLGDELSGELYVVTESGAARGVADRLADLADPFRTAEMSISPVLRPDAYRGELEASVARSLQVMSVVASLAGLLAIVCVNLLNVSSRTAEFGVRRAFGARRSELVSLVIGESTIVGIMGAVLGLFVGFVAIMTVTILARWHPVFDLRLLLVGLGAAVLFGVVGGIAPSIAAGRVEPAEAVRS
ncbi:MAG: ABC transporter ATP-binding protein/permease [Acidimicrobiales bacterium]